MSFKVLITEPVNAMGIDFLKEQGYEVIMGTGASEEILLKECVGVDGVLTRNGKFTAKVFESCPTLKVVTMHGIGVDGIDVDAATAHGVQICNAAESNQTSVAEYAMGLILAHAKHITYYNNGTKADDMATVRKLFGNDIHGKTLGVIGTGTIGTKVCRMAAHGFNMKVVGYSRRITERQDTDWGYLTPDMEEVISSADFLSLHLPSNPGTTKILSAERLDMMKPTAYLINTGRGECVDEKHLIKMLQEGKIKGAALDVFETNLPESDNPMLKMDSVIATPHTAAFTHEALDNMSYQAALGIYETLEKLPVTYPINTL